MAAIASFEERWTKQLIPELVRLGAVSKEGAAIVQSWISHTIQELQTALQHEGISSPAHPVQSEPAIPEGKWTSDQVIKTFLEHPLVTHVAFGAVPGKPGHRVQEIKGAKDNNTISYAQKEVHHKGLFIEQ
ncbi:hypothetical protein J4219_03500 [Candidatus Woesearchaeota archaeon]|nr:hypothetical protein [Candidatus Woesearchaeota archaeon]